MSDQALKKARSLVLMECKRRRCGASAEDVIAAITPVITPLGRTFLRYDESKLAQEAKCDPVKILKNKVLLSALHSIQPNLIFTKSVFKQCLARVIETNSPDNPEWALRPEDQEDYLETMSFRMFNLCHHVSQAVIKKSHLNGP